MMQRTVQHRGAMPTLAHAMSAPAGEQNRLRRWLFGASILVLAVAMIVISAFGVRGQAAFAPVSYTVVVGGTGDPTGTQIEGVVRESGDIRALFDPDTRIIRVQYPASIVGNDADATNLDPSVEVGVRNLLTTLSAIPEGEEVNLVGASQGSIVIAQMLTSMHGKSLLPGPTATSEETRTHLRKLDLRALLAMDEHRPNGGILTRFPGFDLRPFYSISSMQMPDYPDVPSLHVTSQYDGLADFPATFEPIAIINALLGIAYRHGLRDRYVDPNDSTNVYSTASDPEFDDAHRLTIRSGNATDVLLRAEHLPVLRPIRDLGKALNLQWVVNPVLDAVEPLLRNWIEISYDRANPTVLTPFTLLPRLENILTFVLRAPEAIWQGAQNVVHDIGLIAAGKAPDSPLRYDQDTDDDAVEEWIRKNPTSTDAGVLGDDSATTTAPTPTAEPKSVLASAPSSAVKSAAADAAPSSETTAAKQPGSLAPGGGPSRSDSAGPATTEKATEETPERVTEPEESTAATGEAPAPSTPEAPSEDTTDNQEVTVLPAAA